MAAKKVNKLMTTSQAFDKLLKKLEGQGTSDTLKLLKVTQPMVRKWRERFNTNKLRKDDRGDKRGLSLKKMEEILKKAGIKKIPEHWEFPDHL